MGRPFRKSVARRLVAREPCSVGFGKGTLGESPLNGFAKELDERTDFPTLVVARDNPSSNRGVHPIKGLLDGASLLKVLAEGKHARADVHGDTHEGQLDQGGHLHLIGRPAVRCCFGKCHMHG